MDETGCVGLEKRYFCSKPLLSLSCVICLAILVEVVMENRNTSNSFNSPI